MPDPSTAAPLLGLTVELLDAPHYQGRRRFQLFTDYLPCVRAAGATAVLLPTDAPPAEVERLLDLLDGLLLTGGDDPDLRRFGGPAPEETCKPVPPEQQEANLVLVRGARERGMPLLGVCLGMQMMALEQGAAYCQHLARAEEHTKGVLHPVQAAAGSRLAALVGAAPFEVASFHHQAVAAAAGALRVCATAPDGTVEAVELPDHPFALGVQWHPERTPDAAATKALFSGLARAAESYRKERR